MIMNTNKYCGYSKEVLAAYDALRTFWHTCQAVLGVPSTFITYHKPHTGNQVELVKAICKS